MADDGAPVVSFDEYTGVVRRWFRVIVAGVAIGAVLGTLLVVSQPSFYQSEALVEVRPIVSRSDDPNLDITRQVDAPTEVAIANSQRVAERALTLRDAATQLGIELDADEVGELADTLSADEEKTRTAMENLTVGTVGDTNILRFRSEGSNPSTVQALAQSAALAYLSFRHEEAIAGNVDSRARLQRREKELLVDLDEMVDAKAEIERQLTDQAAERAVELAEEAAIDPDNREALEADLRELLDRDSPSNIIDHSEVAQRQELIAIGAKYANLEALAVDPGVILTDAALPETAEGLPLAAGPITGAALGLVVALTAAFFLDRTDDRLRSERAELSALGVPMLGSAPTGLSERDASRGLDGLTGTRLYPVNTAAGDAYRRLHGTVTFNLDSDKKNVVLVAGVTKAAAATTVAINVAATAARAGRRTLVVGADLRNSNLVRYLGLPDDQAGLSDVILAGARLSESVHDLVEVDKLSYLGPGTRLDRPAAVLQSGAFNRMVAVVQADFDLVVVEAPPVLRVADAVDAAGACDGVIVVAERASDSRQAIADSVDQLRGVGADVVGVVVADTKVDDR